MEWNTAVCALAELALCRKCKLRGEAYIISWIPSVVPEILCINIKVNRTDPHCQLWFHHEDKHQIQPEKCASEQSVYLWPHHAWYPRSCSPCTRLTDAYYNTHTLFSICFCTNANKSNLYVYCTWHKTIRISIQNLLNKHDRGSQEAMLLSYDYMYVSISVNSSVQLLIKLRDESEMVG